MQHIHIKQTALKNKHNDTKKKQKANTTTNK